MQTMRQKISFFSVAKQLVLFDVLFGNLNKFKLTTCTCYEHFFLQKTYEQIKMINAFLNFSF